VTLPGWCGVPGAGRSGRLTCFGDSTAGLDRMADRNLGLCESLRRPGLAWPGYRLWQKPAASNLLPFSKVDTSMSTGSSDNPIMSPQALLTG